MWGWGNNKGPKHYFIDINVSNNIDFFYVRVKPNFMDIVLNERLDNLI